jgi:FkbM family methyltransferase
MKNNGLLYNKTKVKNFTPSHVAEIGVWHPHTSNIYQFIKDGIKTTLVEPDPESIKLIKEHFGKEKNVTLHEVAICDFNGKVELCKSGSSTFVSFLTKSPAIINDSADPLTENKFSAKAVKFSQIDDGSIDILSIDIEGCEWFALKHLKSRPTIISIETHGGMYSNPYLKEIKKWLITNDYIPWYKDKSDSVFVKKNKIKVTFLEKISLIFAHLSAFILSKKKRFSKLFRKSK